METFRHYWFFIALVMLAIGVMSQMWKIHKNKSSEDISLIAVTFRSIAMIIILLKMIYMKDWYLISGQGVLIVTYIFYIIMILKYRFAGKMA